MASLQLSKPWQNALIILFNYGMVAVFAMSLAYWTWIFFKPDATPPPSPEPAAKQTLLPSILASHWFGSSDSKVTIYQRSDVRLVGLLSPSQHQAGFAIFKLSNGQQQHAVLQQEIMRGVKLVGISQNSVTISENGVNSEISLENKVDQVALGIATVNATPQIKMLETKSEAIITQPAPEDNTNTKNNAPENTSGMIQRMIKQLH
jgi:hypothetical protein